MGFWNLKIGFVSFQCCVVLGLEEWRQARWHMETSHGESEGGEVGTAA